MDLFSIIRVAAEPATGAAESAAATPIDSLLQALLLPVLMLVVFYFLLIRPQRKREKQTKEMLAALKVGDRVVSIGGIIGKIAAIKDDTVTLEVGADRTKIVLERSAIRGVRQ